MIYYKTRETSIATFLILHDMKYLGVEPINQNSYYFLFENPGECYRLEKLFLETKAGLLGDINEFRDTQY